MNMPTRAYLQSQVQQRFVLRDMANHAVRVQLRRMTEGVAMNPRYESFSIEFALPGGVSVPSGMYAVSREGESRAEWPLLLTSVQPSEDGEQILEAVFHMRVGDKSTEGIR
jgi:hypothetical protein